MRTTFRKICNYVSITLILLLPVLALASNDNKLMTLQVLGSGGPNAIDGRASSGYLIWLDNKAQIMIDAGGGTSLRFGETNADIKDLKLLAITHLHIDHSIDIATMIK